MPKTLSQWGALVKLESPSGTFASPSASTDGILVVDRPDVELDYAHDGSRSGTAGVVLGLAPVHKSGRFGRLTLAHEFAGAGVNHDASNVPSPHTLLRAAGYDVAFSTGIATYTPSAPANYVTASVESYYRGQKAQLAGCLMEMAIEAELGAVPKAMFEAMGTMAATPSDASVPSITYGGAQAIDPAKAEALALSIGGFTPARVKSFAFRDQRSIAPRAFDNANGVHGGFWPGAERVITLDVVIESEALASLDAYTIAEQSTNKTLAMNVGATAKKRWQLTAPRARLLTLPEQDDANVAQWNLQFRLYPSAFGQWDAVSLVFPAS